MASICVRWSTRCRKILVRGVLTRLGNILFFLFVKLLLTHISRQWIRGCNAERCESYLKKIGNTSNSDYSNDLQRWRWVKTESSKKGKFKYYYALFGYSASMQRKNLRSFYGKNLTSLKWRIHRNGSRRFALKHRDMRLITNSITNRLRIFMLTFDFDTHTFTFFGVAVRRSNTVSSAARSLFNN